MYVRVGCTSTHTLRGCGCDCSRHWSFRATRKGTHSPHNPYAPPTYAYPHTRHHSASGSPQPLLHLFFFLTCHICLPPETSCVCPTRLLPLSCLIPKPCAHAATLPKTLTYALASLLMLSMGDTRNSAVVARAGAIPALVSIAREASQRPPNRELAAALLAVMCRSQAAQVEVVAAGGIPALTRWVRCGC